MPSSHLFWLGVQDIAPGFQLPEGKAWGSSSVNHHPWSQDPVPHFLSFAAVQVSDPMSRNHGPPETWHKNGAGPRDLLLSVALNSVGKTQSWEGQMSSVISCAVIKTGKKLLERQQHYLWLGGTPS